MQYFPVHWSEGLFLLPHHFQAADRHLAEMLGTSLEFDHPYGYGVYSLQIDQGSLEQSLFKIQILRARMRDGTIIDQDVGQEEADVIDLEEKLKEKPSVLVLVAVPRTQLGTPNVNVKRAGKAGDQGDPHTSPRYHRFFQTLQDESRGGNEKRIEVKSLHWRLLTEYDDTEGYDVLPLARVERASHAGARAQVDRTYIPPVLTTTACAGLSLDIIKKTAFFIEKRIESLGQQLAGRGVTFDSREPGDLAGLLMLDRLFESHAGLDVFSSGTGVHPFVAYVEMVRVVGRIAIFKDRVHPEIPPYDHDNLGPVFHKLMNMIETRVNAFRSYEYEQLDFFGMGSGLQVTPDTKWFDSNWQWFVGVHKGELNDLECQDLLSSNLDWKLGSRRQVESLFTRGAEGLRIAPLKRPPRALPTSSDWIYFDVSRANEAWKDVQADKSLAMRLNHLIISNPDQLQQGGRWLIVNWKGRQVSLRFALFAVPPE